MTVEELIAELKKHPAETQVYTHRDAWVVNVSKVVPDTCLVNGAEKKGLLIL